MRILVGMPEEGSRGGPAACEPPFVEELRRLGHEVDEVVYAYADSEATLPRRISRVRTTAKRWRKHIGRRQFDIVHINTAFDMRAVLRDSFVLSCLPSGRGKIFLKFHGSDPALLNTINPVLRGLVRYLLSRADAIGVLSSEERNSFLDFGVAPKKVFLVKNAIRTRGQRADIRGQMAIGDRGSEVEDQKAGIEGRGKKIGSKIKPLDLRDEVPVLLFIARFIPTKGLVDVIRACKFLKERGRDFVLVCVGDGPELDAAEREVKRLDLASQVRFTGYVPEEEAANFYAQSTMLLFPTYHNEGFPMVIFNALAGGLPIITTRIRAAADYLTEPANCLWVRAKDPEMLAERIETLLNDADLRSQMQTNNRALSERFTAKVVTREYLDIFESLLTN